MCILQQKTKVIVCLRCKLTQGEHASQDLIGS